MTRIETVENMVKTILSDESKVLGTDEYNNLIAKAETKEEILVTAKVEASVSASEEKEADDKKRGFFGRIFGRK